MTGELRLGVHVGQQNLAIDGLQALWRREMSMRSYHPRWLDFHAGGERFPVLAFIANRACSGHAGRLPVETVVQAIATARGKFGTSAEYLFQTQATLESHGILDARVKRLAERVRSHLARHGAGGHAPA